MLDLVQEYTGHPFDQVLNLYYAKARMYDAQDRRFLAADPVKGTIINPQSLVQHAYVLNNRVPI
jgi:RHS repeat-associated protein